MRDHKFRWPQGDRHFPEDWQTYQRPQRQKLRELRDLLLDQDNPAPLTRWPQRGCFLDIGAHAGSWTCDLRDDFDSFWCIEPLHWQCLSENLHNLGVKRAQVTPVAASDHEGTAEFYQRFDNSGDSGIDLGSEDHPRVRLEIKTQCLDQLRHQLKITDRITAVKIDTQGHELRVLTGMRETIHSDQPVICVELNHGDLAVEQLLLSWRYEFKARIGKDWLWQPLRSQ